MKIVKIVVGVMLMLFGITTLATESFIGGLLILVSGLILIPPVEQKLKSKFKILNKKAAYFVAILIPFAIGGKLSQDAENLRIEKNIISNKQVIAYIQNDTLDKSMQNVRKLVELGKLFGDEIYTLERTKEHLRLVIDSTSNKLYFEFSPVEVHKIKSFQTKFLKDVDDKGKLDKYLIRFEVDSTGTILNKTTALHYTLGSHEQHTSNNVPSLDNFINKNIIAKQKKIVEEKQMIAEAEALVQKQKEEYNKRAKKFEKDCLNPWDGSHIKFTRKIKESMNDPDSFKHVTTTYRLFNGYAIINMTFRGKNAFNATVTNKLSAKVSLKDCSVIEVIE